MMDQKPAAAAHVLMFPLPLQGPVNSMLKLAELLCLGGLHVTFLVTDHIHHRLQRHSNIHTRFQSYPGFQLRTISDGLPENHPRGDKFLELIDSLRTHTKPLFKEMLGSCGCRVSCVIADGVLGFPFDVANDVGIPTFYVRTISAACLWVFFSLPQLIHSREIPFQGHLAFLFLLLIGSFLFGAVAEFFLSFRVCVVAFTFQLGSSNSW